jgi:hypothetical protein
MGRIVARDTGAGAAMYDMLYLVDSRVIPDPDVLTTFARIGYQPNIGGDHHLDKYRSPFDTLFYLIRRKTYRPYYPQYLYEDGRDFYYIDEGNFDETPKGMSSVFISKELFLSAIPEDKGKMVNDDTRLLREIVKKTRILRHSDVKVTYLQRTGFLEVMRHIYERGPRFADYYLGKDGRYRKVGLTTLLWVAIFFIAGFFNTDIVLLGVVMILALYTISAFWLAENLRDFCIVLSLLPPISLSFGAGVLKGILIGEFTRVFCKIDQ